MSSESDRVFPLEHVAPIFVEPSGGYVDIEQTHGDHTLYTPEEARELAADILRAADAAESE